MKNFGSEIMVSVAEYDARRPGNGYAWWSSGKDYAFVFEGEEIRVRKADTREGGMRISADTATLFDLRNWDESREFKNIGWDEVPEDVAAAAEKAVEDWQRVRPFAKKVLDYVEANTETTGFGGISVRAKNSLGREIDVALGKDDIEALKHGRFTRRSERLLEAVGYYS